MEIQHDIEQQRFFVESTDLGVAELSYRKAEDTLTATHTFVPPAFRGQGIAGRLSDAFIAYAKENALVASAECSYVVAHLKRRSKQDSTLS
ncbi:MAG: GNAT family N-acetyltransferase [Opitutales bacterium]